MSSEAASVGVDPPLSTRGSMSLARRESAATTSADASSRAAASRPSGA